MGFSNGYKKANVGLTFQKENDDGVNYKTVSLCIFSVSTVLVQFLCIFK